MPELIVDGSDLRVELSPLGKLAALDGGPRVPLRAITSVQVDPDPWSSLRGIRAPGTGFPGVIAYGTRVRLRASPDFAALRGRAPAVRVDLDDSAPYGRLVITVPDPAATVDRIRAALGTA
jgi:hypothetical protein